MQEQGGKLGKKDKGQQIQPDSQKFTTEPHFYTYTVCKVEHTSQRKLEKSYKGHWQLLLRRNAEKKTDMYPLTWVYFLIVLSILENNTACSKSAIFSLPPAESLYSLQLAEPLLS